MYRADEVSIHRAFCKRAIQPYSLGGGDTIIDTRSALKRKCSPDAAIKIDEPGHEKMCLLSYANNKGADQPAHPRSLISAFIVRCLDSIISLDSVAEISRL